MRSSGPPAGEGAHGGSGHDAGADLAALLGELSQAPGVPGQEGPVRAVLQARLDGVPELGTDRLGSLTAVCRGGPSGGPRIMVAAHMDEVGFLVSRITDDGFLRFVPLGGWWEQVMLAQRVVVRTRRGELAGVVGSKPPHILDAEARKKLVEKKAMWIDVGAGSRAEAEALGVRPGDAVVPVCPFTALAGGRLWMGKAMDDRAGCAVLASTLLRLGPGTHPNEVWGVFTVQEEVGLRGAQTAAARCDPDVGLAVDVAIAGDTPGTEPEEAQARLGSGPVLLLHDASLVPHVRLRDLVADTAEAEGIPYQFDVMPGGGTDAGRIALAGEGVPALVLGIPARYIHSAAAVVARQDMESTARLLEAVIRRLDAAAVEALRG